MVFDSCSAAAQASFRGAVYGETGDAAGGEWSIWGLVVGVGRGKTGRPSGIVEPRHAKYGSGDERNETFGRGAGAVDATNPLRAAMR